MGKISHDLVWEENYLQKVLDFIKIQLSAREEKNLQDKKNLVASRKDMWENTSSSSSDFDRAIELTQYLQPLMLDTSSLLSNMDKIQVLQNMLDTPYFSRIDFKMDGAQGVDKIYIGRSNLMDDATNEIYVFDWRAPIASLFYQFESGRAYYQAPMGKITGEISLKRQYEIKKGILHYYFDADVQIADEFLRNLLSQNSSTKMKSIVETIQKDQDKIIRDTDTDVLIVQGVAGSGKTSVALHRAAYLMYQGLSSKLAANDIMILSPNTLFEQYISAVLPELGEENVTTATFDDCIKTILKEDCPLFQGKNQLLEDFIACDTQEQKSLLKASFAFKTSQVFIQLLNRYCEEFASQRLAFTDIQYNNQCIFTKQELQEKFLQDDPAMPLGVRLKRLERFILDKIHDLHDDRMAFLEEQVRESGEHSFDWPEYARLLSIQESTALILEIRKFTEISYTAFYQQLFLDKKLFFRLAEGLVMPACIDKIITYTQNTMKSQSKKHEDALALAYLILKLQGCREYQNIRQVMIDEAQDYNPLHFEILKGMFAKAQYTVLGDINQTLEKQEELDFYHAIPRLLGKKKSLLVMLSKSFRCTAEITKYSEKFITPTIKIESFSRNGEAPQVYGAKDEATLDELLRKEILQCREKNYQSIGLLCKSGKDAANLYQRLKDTLEIQLVKQDNFNSIKGACIIPIYLAKGLEFDAVLLCDADDTHYVQEDDKKLLYIACTRALHRLNLFYTGNRSPFL